MDDQALLIGDKLWCIQPDLESYGSGDRAPRHPWPGLVTRMQTGMDGTLAYIEISLLDGDGVPDRDVNATAGCDSADDYARDEATAWVLWKKAMGSYIARLEEEIQHARQELQEHKKTSPPQEATGAPGKP